MCICRYSAFHFVCAMIYSNYNHSDCFIPYELSVFCFTFSNMLNYDIITTECIYVRKNFKEKANEVVEKILSYWKWKQNVQFPWKFQCAIPAMWLKLQNLMQYLVSSTYCICQIIILKLERRHRDVNLTLH